MGSAQSHRPSAPSLDSLPAGTVERLRAGDVDAFKSVYEAYRARLYSFLLRLCRDEQLARDLAQETWLRLAANARRLEPETQPAAWLFRVARNLFVSQRRWATIHEAAVAALRAFGGARSPETPLERVSTDALERRLERALASLPLRYREVVLLIAIEGFSTEDVAGMLGITSAAVRQRLARGRAAIKQTLEDGNDAARAHDSID